MSQTAYIKREFVRQILEDEGKKLYDNQGLAITKLLHFQSGRLQDERKLEIKTDDEMDGMLTLTIPWYGRVLDIKPKNRSISATEKYGLWSRRRKTKAFPIYNRFVFGHYYTIAYRLMYGFTNEVADNIKKQFESEN